MSMSVAVTESNTNSLFKRLVAFVELTKPRIGILVLATVATAASMASWGQPNPALVLHAMFGTLLVACAAGAANQWLEQHRDKLMPRTVRRPLITGTLTNADVLAFTMITLTVGLAWLLVFVNITSFLFAAFTWLLYVLVYTPLKTVTSWNTAIGAIPGALPVLIGWSCVNGTIDFRAIALFSLLFFWQFPHFMAIAWIYRHQYEKAGFKMLPNVDLSGKWPGFQAVFTAAALLPISLMPVLHLPGWGCVVYAIVAVILGTSQLYMAIRFAYLRNDTAARKLLWASLIYLPLILLSLVLFPGA
jgi:heme o synthase